MIDYMLAVIGGALGILFTAMVGSSVAAAWQRRSWMFEQRRSRLLQNYTTKTEIITTLHPLVRERITASRVYAEIMRTHNIDKILIEREKYRSVVEDWNSVFPAQVTRMKFAFSHALAYDFDNFFPKEFQEMDTILRRARILIEEGDFEVDHLLNEADGIGRLVNIHGEKFFSDLFRSSEKEKRVLEEQPEINHENRQSLSYSYLLKALFNFGSHSDGV